METSEFQVPTLTEVGSIAGLTKSDGASADRDAIRVTDPNTGLPIDTYGRTS